MKLFIYYLLFLLFFITNVKAHECILSGTTAKEITIYNTCLTNSKKSKNNKLVTVSMLKFKNEQLKKENALLRKKLLEIKVRFDNISVILNSYVKN